MKERPILMSAPMVRALLRPENPKTQTRRVVKPQPEYKHGFWHYRGGPIVDFTFIPCPYGVPGDLLWVKETWAPHLPHLRKVTPRRLKKREVLNFAADYAHPGDVDRLGPWQSPLFMMRHQSRLTLEITAIRVERLHAISEADAIAEGIEWLSSGWRDYSKPTFIWLGRDTARRSYQSLWESINNDPKKPDARWSANPWVWVVEFKRV